jgi:16S rRNA (cytosine967-C5)-methyltransferase
MADLQAQLLARAADWLAPGGTLVYATCSLEPEEGEHQAAGVTLEPLAIEPVELPADLVPSLDGTVRTRPGQLAEFGGIDGFFIVRWRRAAQ